jgi:hypothetical protein
MLAGGGAGDGAGADAPPDDVAVELELGGGLSSLPRQPASAAQSARTAGRVMSVEVMLCSWSGGAAYAIVIMTSSLQPNCRGAVKTPRRTAAPWRRVGFATS